MSFRISTAIRKHVFASWSSQNCSLSWNKTWLKYCTSLAHVQDALAVEKAAVLTRALQCEESEAKDIVKRNIYLLVKDEESLEHKARFLRSCFTLQDISKHCEILTLPLGPVRQNYRTMTEFGLQNLTCSTLMNFKSTILKAPTELIKMGHLDETSDILQHVLSVINKPEFSKLATEEFPRERYMNGPVVALKRSLLPRYLAYTLNTSIDQARLIIRLHYALPGRCFTDINECFSILQNIFKFTIEKIKVNPYLLHQEPSNLYKIASLESLMGGNPIEMGQKFPKVISRPVDNLLKIETLLREQGVSEEDIRESRYLFMLNPLTVRDLIIKRKLKKMLCR